MYQKRFYFREMGEMKFLQDTTDIGQFTFYLYLLSLIFLKTKILSLKIKILIG